ncbi:14047_t:CDS:1, partial [Gigaspora rosea]
QKFAYSFKRSKRYATTTISCRSLPSDALSTMLSAQRCLTCQVTQDRLARIKSLFEGPEYKDKSLVKIISDLQEEHEDLKYKYEQLEELYNSLAARRNRFQLRQESDK